MNRRLARWAGNPFAPGWTRDPTTMDAHQVTVNGDVVFTPGANGVTVNGTRTDYPSMEVYQDMPNGMTHTVLIDNAAAGGQQGSTGARQPISIPRPTWAAVWIITRNLGN